MRFTVSIPFKTICLFFSTLFIFSVGFSQGETPRIHKYENSIYTAQNIQDYTNMEMPYEDTEVNSFGSLTLEPETYILLSIDNDEEPFRPYDFTLNLKVYPYVSDGTIDNTGPYPITLKVEFNPQGNIGNTVDQVYHKIGNRYGAQVIVVDYSVTYNDNDATSTTDVPGNINLTLGYKAIHVKNLAGQQAPSASISFINGEYVINWDSIIGAISYDVEWTWVDTYGNISTNMTIEKFRSNSTRVNTKDVTYKIPNIFDTGKIYVRVRAVGRFTSDYRTNFYGPWSNGFPSLSTNEHDNKKNWQFQASYAEEGKKKEVVSYYDGTLRNRQTVTKINSDDNAVVGEVIYDNQGRPAIEVLPVPDLNDNELKFHKDFNMSSYYSGEIYSHKDFDWDLPSDNPLICDINVNGLDASFGASRYYSEETLIDSNSEFKDFVPDAQGFPFSQIEYTPDNTGRIKRKSGVGPTYQLGTQHEMKYFYSTPFQPELDRLFGSNVGWNLHYKKNSVIDPNGQVSVSYIDPQGRTIATALMGDNPIQLQELKNEGGDTSLTHNTTTQDLISNGSNNLLINQNGLPGINIDNTLAYNGFKTVLQSGQYLFNYDLTINGAFNYDCFADATEGYPFIFDLDLNIFDDCGNSFLTPEQINELSSTINNFTTEIIDVETGVEDGNPVFSQFNVVELIETTDPPFEQNFTFPSTPTIGDMGISKLLKVNNNALNTFADDYIIKAQLADCILDASDFDVSAVLEDCFQTCEECEEALDADNYVALHLAPYGTLDADTEIALTSRFQRELDLLIEACNAPCSGNGISTNPDDTLQSASCSVIESLLLQDMRILGQYGLQEQPLPSDGGGTDVAVTPIDVSPFVSIFSETNILFTGFVEDKFEIPLTIMDNYSWRTPFNPKYDDNGAIGHYYDENGEVALIQLEVINGGFVYRPEIIDNPTTLIADPDGNPNIAYIEPQELAHFDFTDLSTTNGQNDFKAHWQSSWAESLVVFHPEYCYVKYAEIICGMTSSITNSGPNELFMNPDGFDDFLQDIDYATAVSRGYLDILSNNQNNTILLDDPFFKVELPTELGFGVTNVHKNKMIGALDNYEAANVTMLNMAYKSVFCSSIGFCFDNLTSLSQITPDIEEPFWEAYRGYYMAFKNRITQALANRYAIKNGCYNDCIEPSDNGDSPNLGLSGLPAGTSISGNVCSYSTEGYYTNKVRRYTTSDAIYDAGGGNQDNINDLEEYTDYNYYLETGECPLLRDFEAFLNGMVIEVNGLSTNGLPKSVVRDGEQFRGNYFSMDLFNDLVIEANQANLGTYDNVQMVSLISNSDNRQLEISYSADSYTTEGFTIGPVETAPILLNLPNSFSLDGGTTSLTWADYIIHLDDNTDSNVNGFVITEIKNVFYQTYTTNPTRFEFSAIGEAHLVINGEISEIYNEVILSGSTKARIGACSIDGQADVVSDDNGPIGEDLGDGGPLNDTECDETFDFTTALKNVFVHLEQSGNFLSSTFNLSDLGSIYNDSFLPLYFSDTYLNGVWQFNSSTNTGSINIDGITVFEIIFDADIINRISNGSSQSFLNFQSLHINEDVMVIIFSHLSGPPSNIVLLKPSTTDITNLEFDCCTYITNIGCTGTIDTDLDGTPDECDNTPCGDVDSDNDGIYDACDDDVTPLDCSDITCDTAFIELLNYLITLPNHLYDDNYNLSSQSSFYNQTCLDEFYQIGVDDVLVWIANSTNSVFSLVRNGITIATFSPVTYDGVNPNPFNLSTLDINEFTSIDLPLPGEETGIVYYTDNTNTTQSFEYIKGVFICDVNTICDRPSGQDSDNDGIDDNCDSCPDKINIGDDDGDGIDDACDTCLGEKNIGDSDGDGIDDACDDDINTEICLEEVRYQKEIFNQGMADLFNHMLEQSEGFYTNLPVDSYVSDPLKLFFRDNARNLLEDDSVNFTSIKWDAPFALDANLPKTVKLAFEFTSLNQQSGTYHVLIELTESIIVNNISNNDPFLEFDAYEVPQDLTPINYKVILDNDQFQSHILRIYQSKSRGFRKLYPLNFDCKLDELRNSEERKLAFEETLGREGLNLDDDECIECIPQAIMPVDGEDMYTLFLDIVSDIDNYIVPEHYTLDYFRDMNFAYLVAGYQAYINAFTIETVEDSNFINIATFGSTALNYGFNNYSLFINGYKDYLTIDNSYMSEDDPNFLTWGEYVIDYLSERTDICPPKAMTPSINIGIVDPNSDCTEFSLNVSEAYGADNYANYINRIKRQFKIDYTEAALQSIQENFNLSYDDKEYQYTLYYYDQAGNLTQTVPPEGVKRKEFIEVDPQQENDDLVSVYDVDRESNDVTVSLPEHELKTLYKYNSLNQLIWQKTPDGGETRFAYDKLGRIIASQNAVQVPYRFSYTIYDDLGRIHEAGEIQTHSETTQYEINDLGLLNEVGSSLPLDSFDDSELLKREVTRTIYDDRFVVEGSSSVGGILFSNELFITNYNLYNSINRVTGVLYYDNIDSTETESQFDNALMYNYDVHGNVKELVTYISELKIPNCIESKSVRDCEIHIKRVIYNYDLISGNVKTVTYQPNRDGESVKPDLFIHKYEYDGDNRIIAVKTSRDGNVWENDANYKYYEHGPLARVEIGDKKIQGADYIYTLQGWLKSVNGESLANINNDAGHDGLDNHAKIAKDAYGYALNYFSETANNSADYTPINSSIANNILKLTKTNIISDNNKNLYNGNIKRMITTLRDNNENILTAQGNNYSYDQLNRISSMTSQSIVDKPLHTLNVNDSYSSSYEYDRNGNLEFLKRSVPNNGALIQMDDFEYHYKPNTNQLLTVEDIIDSELYDSDLDNHLEFLQVSDFDVNNQSSHNYEYDAIGQLALDKSEGLKITWRADGKVREIHKYLGKYPSTIRFKYDGLGNRIAKEVITESGSSLVPSNNTLYSRDAQGNVLGVYDYYLESGRGGKNIDFGLAENHLYGSSRLGVEKNKESISKTSYSTHELFTKESKGQEDMENVSVTTFDDFDKSGLRTKPDLNFTWESTPSISSKGVFNGFIFNTFFKAVQTEKEAQLIELNHKNVEGNALDQHYSFKFKTLKNTDTNLFALGFSIKEELEDEKNVDSGIYNEYRFQTPYYLTANSVENEGLNISLSYYGQKTSLTINNKKFELESKENPLIILKPEQVEVQTVSNELTNRIGSSDYGIGYIDFSYINYGFDISNSDTKDLTYFSFLEENFLKNSDEVSLSMISDQNYTEVDYKIENYFYTDNDLDSVYDFIEDLNQDGNAENDDSDNDGIPNYKDNDDDNDKVLTINEINLDTDSDGILDYLDTDDDDDGILTIDEGSKDDDNDGIANYLDNTMFGNPVTANLYYANYLYKIGDKNYELSNHLGNVLSVVTDRKIVQFGLKKDLIYKDFKDFKEDGEKTYISGELQCVNVYNGTGTLLPIELEGGYDYFVNTYLHLEEYHSAVNIFVEDDDGNNYYSNTITETGEVTFSFSVPSNDTYRIRFLKNNLENPEDAHEEAFHLKYFELFLLKQSDEVDGFLPDVIAYNDYYPFGMLMPNRHGSIDSYRYGFQGQEKDDEIKGEGNSVNYKYRMHDPRVGRFFAVDPLTAKYAWNSPYVFSENRVISSVEMEGLEASDYRINNAKKYAEYELLGDYGISQDNKYLVVRNYDDITKEFIIKKILIDGRFGFFGNLNKTYMFKERDLVAGKYDALESMAENVYKSIVPPKQEWFYDTDTGKYDQTAYFSSIFFFSLDVMDGPLPSGKRTTRKNKKTSKRVSLRGKSLKWLKRKKPKGWKTVKADGNGWKWIDDNGVERLRFMRPKTKEKVNWTRESQGYFRWKNERGEFLDVDGGVVPKPKKGAPDAEWEDFYQKTHIPYEGPTKG